MYVDVYVVGGYVGFGFYMMVKFDYECLVELYDFSVIVVFGIKIGVVFIGV